VDRIKVEYLSEYDSGFISVCDMRRRFPEASTPPSPPLFLLAPRDVRLSLALALVWPLFGVVREGSSASFAWFSGSSLHSDHHVEPSVWCFLFFLPYGPFGLLWSGGFAISSGFHSWPIPWS